VVSFQIGRRKREMGIRKAVGATERDLRRLVVGGALRQTSIGIVLGLITAIAVTRFLGELLYGIEPMDRLTTLVATVVIAAAALVASYVPAKRLSRIHPSDVLGSD